MKKYICILGLSLASFSMKGQILTNSVPSPAIYGSNAFLDASTSYGKIAGENNNKHKGLVFPDVDLTTFEFENVVADGATFPSYYDGMVVYNTATGTTASTGNNPAVAVAVTPGFYYFSNPNGGTNANVTAGKWMPLGSGATSTTIKGLVNCAGTITQTIADANVTATATIYVSYEDTSGDIIYTSIKNRVAGTGFTVQFGALPSTSAKINYIIVL